MALTTRTGIEHKFFFIQTFFGRNSEEQILERCTKLSALVVVVVVVVVVKNSIPKQELGDHLVQASGEIKSDNFLKKTFYKIRTRDISIKISKFFN